MKFDKKKATTVENNIDFWKPEEAGMSLLGVYKETFNNPQFGATYILEDEEGTLHGTPSHKQLQAKMNKVPVGSLVNITFTGRGEAKVGQSAPSHYTVEYILPGEH